MSEQDMDLDTELGNAFDAAVSSSEAPATTDVATSTPATESTETQAPASTGDRDERGRFKGKQQVTDTTLQPSDPAAPTNPLDASQTEGIKQENTSAAALPPSTFTPEGKAEFMKASPALQKEILKREQDMMRGIEQYREAANTAERVQRAFSPYMATINSLGVTPEVAIQHLLTADHKLRYGSPHEKAAELGRIAQQFGVDIGQLSTEQPAVDPTVQALQSKINQLEQYLNQQTTQAQTAEQQFVKSEISKFESNPENLYFNDVRGHMGALLNSGQATDLKDAYDKACWANPQIREILQRQQNEESERKRLADLAQKSQTAKRAGFDVQGTGSSAATSNKALSLEEEIAAQLG
jgi:hypothetical protein